MHRFTAPLWLWDARRSDTWTFVTLPTDVSADIADHAAEAGPPAGFGSVRVEVTVGATTWRTSVFPDKDSGCYVLPIKAAVRRSEQVEAGDDITVEVRPV